jgi:hypothetical protein
MKCSLIKLLLVGGFLLVLVGGAELHEGDSVSQAEPFIPTNTGLDFNQVEVFVHTEHEFWGPLVQHTIGQLTKAGLIDVERRKVTKKTVTLELTLDPIPLDQVCPGKVMYVKKLELWETVHPERNPRITARSVTWSEAPTSPDVTNRLTIEQLKADADGYLANFIATYKLGKRIEQPQGR